MKQLKKNIRLMLIALLPAFYACSGNAAGSEKINTADSKKNNTAESVKTAADAPGAAAANTLSDEQQFRLFFTKFKNAVKSSNKAQVTQLFNFPLQTLPQWTNDELKSTAINVNEGLISAPEFSKYYQDIFTKDAVKLVPASLEDDLSEIEKNTTENYYLTLMKVTDKGSTLYELEKQYAEDNGKETSFGFVFGKVKGAYKVISYYRPWPLK